MISFNYYRKILIIILGKWTVQFIHKSYGITRLEKTGYRIVFGNNRTGRRKK